MIETRTSWIPDTATFGARLALVRWRMGWNLKEAATECNLPSTNSWSNWEEGAMPRNYVDVVNRIVLRTRVDKVWLMTGEGSPEPTGPKAGTSDYKSEVVHVDFSSKDRPASRRGNTHPSGRAA